MFRLPLCAAPPAMRTSIPARAWTAPRLRTAVQLRRCTALPLARHVPCSWSRAERRNSHLHAQSSGRGDSDFQDAALRFGRSATKKCVYSALLALAQRLLYVWLLASTLAYACLS